MNDSVKLLFAIAISIAATWCGKNNLAWAFSQTTGQNCSPTWLLIKCES